MPIITFSDGTKCCYKNPVNVMDVILDINPRIAKTVVAGYVNNKILDVSDLIEVDSTLSFITDKDTEGLKIIRRTCAYLLGHAIKKLWPDSKIAVSSVVNNGFCYDIDLNHKFSQENLNEIENCMRELAKKKYDIIKKKTDWHEARKIFINCGEEYKVSLLDEALSKEERLSLYYHETHVDISQWPHAPNMSFCCHFKLMKISGAYWRGNKKNKMLQRIFGTAWRNKKELNSHLQHLEESSKRDHRKIGKQLDLYHIQDDARGMIFWHNNGWIIFQELKNFIRTKLKKYHYHEVKSPFMMDRSLWEKTSHWENYKDAMFTTSFENREYCIKPMNCPGHVQIFNQGTKSYRDLPLRIAEFGSCHRNEPSGALHGLMRVREVTQDDAHIFCTKKQIRSEISACIHMVYDIYSTFGLEKISVKLSTRPERRIGSDEVWDRAEEDLAISLKENNILFEYQMDEGAFYGPKIEFVLRDYLDRAWQCGTIQLDFSLPSRLNAFYVDENNKRQVPVMIHRAILGSIERFIGILTEELSGFFPTWLAPIQMVVANITSSQNNYVKEVTRKLQNVGFRVKADLRNEKIGFKIREHVLHRIPYVLVCGEKEMETNKVSVRTRLGKNLGSMDINEITEKLQEEIRNRNLKQLGK